MSLCCLARQAVQCPQAVLPRMLQLLKHDKSASLYSRCHRRKSI